MEYTSKNCLLKNGANCLVRRPEAEDAEQIVRYQRETSVETPYLIVGPEDITQTTEEQALRLLAEVEGGLAGIAILYGVGMQSRLRHRCSVDITLYQKFCGIGIGTLLLGEILEAAKTAGYLQAELEVVSSNRPAIGLYQKLGFETVGSIPRALQYPDGSFADFLLMVKVLD